MELRGFSKAFSGVHVLHNVDLTVYAGEVHGLVGQNGSGKSTLIKILAGYHEPDPGASLKVGGRAVSLPVRQGEAHELGLSFVHQDLALVSSMSVLENLVVGRGYQTGLLWKIRWQEERCRTRELLSRFELNVNPDVPISQLGQGERAIVAIIRALEQLRVRGTGVIVLDEPTAHLPAPDVERLFEAIRTAVSQGASAIFVSHRLDEVRAITDRVSVLRDGYLAGTAITAEADEQELARMLLGRDLGEAYLGPAKAEEEVVLSVRGLTGRTVKDLSFDLHMGEVLGITGLLGMGHDEVPYLVFGRERALTGTVFVRGRELRHRTPRTSLRAGIALLPADRQHDGSMQTATVRENVTLPIVRQFFKTGLLRHQMERRSVAALLTQFDVRPPESERMLNSLSGGNQQKALLAKWLQLQPPVLLLHEPTHGVDVGARQQIFEVIRESTVKGTGILFCSAEYEDLAHLCDRVLVLRIGRVVAELMGESLTEERIIEQAYLSPAPGSVRTPG